MKIGFFGGSFDPVHRAHDALARQAMNQFSLDRVIWIPAAVSPFKSELTANALPEQRLDMVKLVCNDEPRFEISDFEIKKGGISYSIDTVRHFRQIFPTAEFYWILGADNLSQIEEWREADALMRDLVFLAAPRGKTIPSVPEQCSFRTIDLEWNPVTSTVLRESLSRGVSWDQVHPAVAEYIRRNRLYGVAP